MPQYCDFITTDVFTDTPFAGNPLAVVSLPSSTDSPLSQRQKQLIAREFNFSETVFVHHPDDCPAEGESVIDIFTTETELPFAGHPTIGTACRLLASAKDGGGVKVIVTKAGKIPFSADGAGRVTAHIPHDTRLHSRRFPASELLRLHGSLAGFISPAADFPVFSIVNGMSQIHVELPSLQALAALTTSSGGECVRGDATYHDEGWVSDFILVYFFVRDVGDEKSGQKVIRTRAMLGSLEDPATGSAASGLGAYLSLAGGKQGVHEYHIVQGVEMGRRSEIGVEVLMVSGKVKSVQLAGTAVEISSGRIMVPG